MAGQEPGFVPYFTYDDAKTAMAFLESAFGFETLASYTGEDGRIMHGEMRFGRSVMMLGSGEPGERARQIEAGTAGPGVYCVVDNVDRHYDRAKAAGARIVYPPEDTEFGTRRYRTHDSEGYEWSFGTYVPGTPG